MQLCNANAFFVKTADEAYVLENALGSGLCEVQVRLQVKFRFSPCFQGMVGSNLCRCYVKLCSI